VEAVGVKKEFCGYISSRQLACHMPITYTIDTKERVIRTRCVGMVTFAEVVDHFRELERDSDSSGQLDVLLDLSEMSSLPQTSQIQAVPYEISRIREKVRFGACAIVALSDPLFGMLRMFEVLAQRYFRAIHVFRSGADAEAWLESQKRSSRADSRSISASMRPEAGDEA
jgi:hypothetical protein